MAISLQPVAKLDSCFFCSGITPYAQQIYTLVHYAVVGMCNRVTLCDKNTRRCFISFSLIMVLKFILTSYSGIYVCLHTNFLVRIFQGIGMVPAGGSGGGGAGVMPNSIACSSLSNFSAGGQLGLPVECVPVLPTVPVQSRCAEYHIVRTRHHVHKHACAYMHVCIMCVLKCLCMHILRLVKVHFLLYQGTLHLLVLTVYNKLMYECVFVCICMYVCINTYTRTHPPTHKA
jgi:hypothetical protein